MDIMGFTLIGTITGIGGGTLRDLLLGRAVWWTENPLELLLCVGVSMVTFFAVSESVARRSWVQWSDAITGTKPMVTEGQLYATAALIGAACYALLYAAGVAEVTAEGVAFLACFLVRAAAIVFDVRMGPPGEFIRIGVRDRANNTSED